MRKKIKRADLCGPEGSERRKFMERKGMVRLGRKKLSEETARKLNQHMKDIDDGKIKEGIPGDVLRKEKKLFRKNRQ